MNIVITGGNGYLGARLSLFLVNKGHNIIPVCFPSYSPQNIEWKNKMATIIEGDLRKQETIKKIAALNPEVIIHLVSLDHFKSERAPRFVNEVNVLPTWRLLDSCTKNGLDKFIYFSTTQVYGKLSNVSIDESHPINTKNIYGLTHFLSENICSHFNRNTSTNVISVRLSNSYGDPIFPENNCWWLAVNDLCKSAFLNKEIRLLSDGSPQRDFIHGNDVCEAIDCLINTNKKYDDNVYHVSFGNTITLMELAQIIKKEYKSRYNVTIPIISPHNNTTPENNIINYTNKYTISNNKLKLLGFFPVYSINRGVNELFNYFEKHYKSISEI